MSSKKLNLFKDFQSDQIQRSSHKIFTAHYACRNEALNLTPVTGTTNGFIFQIINSLIESWGVRPWLGLTVTRNKSDPLLLCLQICLSSVKLYVPCNPRKFSTRTFANSRGAEWYLGKRGSRKILAGSRNLGSVFDKSRSLVFSWFVFTFFESRNFSPKSLGLGFLTRISASRRVSDFTIRHP